MSNPYVQFELDAAKKAPLLASALGIQIREAIGGLALMWLHAYGSECAATATVSPFYLRTFFGVDGAVVADALAELGFLELVAPSTWRIRGAGRYTKLSEKRQEAGRKGAEVTNARRKVAAANADGKPVLPQQKPGKTTFADRLPRQKTALEPIADRSLPTGERSTRHEDAVERDPSPASPDGAGAVAPEAPWVEPPPEPPPELPTREVPTRCRRLHTYFTGRDGGQRCPECAVIDDLEAEERDVRAALQRADLSRGKRPKPPDDATEDDQLAAMVAWTESIKAQRREAERDVRERYQRRREGTGAVH